jgi:ATP-dependent DNA helicase RecG
VVKSILMNPKLKPFKKSCAPWISELKRWRNPLDIFFFFKGTLQVQLREALSFIRATIIDEHFRKIPGKAESEKFYNYPFAAVEEALANAVYHKSYESGKPIEVQIWPDKIEILSFPGPVPPVTVLELAQNQRIVAKDYRNRRVGDFLKELHLTEGRDTGIPTIKRAMRNNGSPDPILKSDEQCSYFLALLPVHTEADEFVNDQVFDQVRSKHETVIVYCPIPRSRKDILEQLGLVNHTLNFRKHLLPIIVDGLILNCAIIKAKYQSKVRNTAKKNKKENL